MPSSRPKPEFTFRPTGSGGPKTELPPNPALERFKEPEPPTPMERMLPMIKGVTAGLAVLLLLMVALYFVPLPGASDTAALDRVSTAMRTVRALPTQHQPLLTLKEATVALPNTADTELVAALRAVVALGELRTGDRTTGTRMCEYVASAYSNTPSAQLVKHDVLSETCKACKGTGRVAETLRSSAGRVQSMDGDTMPCLKCRGKGRIMSDAAVDAQYAKSLDAADSAIKAQNRSGALLSFLLRFQSRLHKAFGRAQPPPSTTPAASTNAPAST
jgi:hypothetical protein